MSDEKHAVRERPVSAARINRTQIAADGRDTAIIRDLPRPGVTVVHAPGRTSTLPIDDDGVLEITTTTPGVYVVVVKAWPYREARFTITAPLTMKFCAEPDLDAIRSGAKQTVDEAVELVARARAHRDAIHARKRAEAQALAADPGAAAPLLRAEAGNADGALAALVEAILAKPDDVAARELLRRAAVADIRAAGSPATILAVATRAVEQLKG